MCIYTYICVYIHIYVYIYTYICVYIHVYVYIYMYILLAKDNITNQRGIIMYTLPFEV